MFLEAVSFTAYIAILTEGRKLPNVGGLRWQFYKHMALVTEGKCPNSKSPRKRGVNERTTNHGNLKRNSGRRASTTDFNVTGH